LESAGSNRLAEAPNVGHEHDRIVDPDLGTTYAAAPKDYRLPNAR